MLRMSMQQVEHLAGPSDTGTVTSDSGAMAVNAEDGKPGHHQSEPRSDATKKLSERAQDYDKKTAPYKCHVCPRSFQDPEMLTFHVATHHADKKRHKCHLCPKSFQGTPDLRIHLLKHEGRKPFPCHLCPAKFVARKYLSDHMQLHDSSKRFKCNLCPKSFLRPGLLTQHITRYHHDSGCESMGVDH